MIYIYKILYFLFADYNASDDLLMAVASSNFSELAFWYRTKSRQAPNTLFHVTYLQFSQQTINLFILHYT